MLKSRYATALFGATLFLGAALPAQAAGLTQAQIQAIVSLLQAFGLDQNVVCQVEIELGGTCAQSVAFSANPTTGSAPLPVSFSASGGLTFGTSYIINYGDGQNSGPLTPQYPPCANLPGQPNNCGPLLNAAHTYTSPGTYVAALSTYTACLYANPPCQIAQTMPLGTATITVTSGIVTSPLTYTVASTPVSQTIIGGQTGVLVSNINLDATQASEDIRMPAIELIYQSSANNLVNTCAAYIGAFQLTSGGNIINPPNTAPSGSINAFRFDNPLIIPHGQVTTISIKCNVLSGVSGTFNWGLLNGDVLNGTGVTSGNTIIPNAVSNPGPTFTVTSGGSLTVTAAANIGQSPSATQFAAGGTTGVQQGLVKLHAANEAVSLTKMGLTLANGAYGSKSTGVGNSSNSGVNDVVTAYIYNGSALIGTATFTGTNQTATSTLSMPITIPVNSDVYLTIKTDLSSIGLAAPGGIGDTVKVDPLNAQAVGQSSGVTLNVSATPGVNGAQIFKSFPTVTLSSGACNGTSCNGVNQILAVNTITANASGPVGVNTLSYGIATSSASVSNLKLAVYDNNGSLVASSYGGTQCMQGCANNNPILTFTGGIVSIPAGLTYTFKLLGTVVPYPNATQWSVSAGLLGEPSALSGQPAGYNMNTAAAVANNSCFVWSDDATTTSNTIGDIDWTNGYNLPGLPAIGFGSGSGQCGSVMSGSPLVTFQNLQGNSVVVTYSNLPSGASLQVINQTSGASMSSMPASGTGTATIALPAQAGTYYVKAVDSNGNYLAQTVSFTGPGSASVISSLSPNSGTVSTPVAVTGTGFTPTGNAITVNGITVSSNLPSTNGTSLTFNFPSQLCTGGTCAVISPATFQVAVVNSSGTSNAVAFTVTAPQPAPATPTGLNVTCNPNNTATFSWSPTAGADHYLLRVDNPLNNGPACVYGGNPQDNWYCPNTDDVRTDPQIGQTLTATTYTSAIVPGRTYNWWLLSSSFSTYVGGWPITSGTVSGNSFSCSIGVASTPHASLPLVHTLAVGSTGPEVSALQGILKGLGFFSNEITGYFGSVTKAAVEAFQSQHNLAAVGVVGPKTRALLKAGI